MWFKLRNIKSVYFMTKPNSLIFIKRIIKQIYYSKIAYMLLMELYSKILRIIINSKLIRIIKISFGGLLM